MNEQSFLKFTPLGGLGETGALNCMLYQTDDTAFVVDCGIGFADEDLPGVNAVIPDFSCLESVRGKLKAVVLTHGHEDHVGALPYFLQKFPVPVFATPFTKEIILDKMGKFGLDSAPVNTLEFNQPVKIGSMRIKPVFVNHSIMDTSALLISTDSVRVFHLTDFKIDHACPGGRVTDLASFGEIGKQGLDLLLLDSTNAFRPGWTLSEARVCDNLIELFTRIKGRIVACLFSSNSFRMQSLLECARITGRKVALTGRSTRDYFRCAEKLGFFNAENISFYDVEEITQFPDEEILVIVTGSQAEPRSVLNRMSYEMFRPFRLKAGDTILMSSRMIPGNEGRILKMLNRLAQQDVEILVSNAWFPFHASGHAEEDELREVIRLLKPKHFVPIHGEYRHLKKNIEIAVKESVAPENTRLVLDGETVELSPHSLKVVDSQDVARKYVSENPRQFILPEAVTRRRKMAWNGLVCVSVRHDPKRAVVLLPLQCASEGIFGGAVEAQALKELVNFLENILKEKATLEKEKLIKFFKVETRQFYKSRFGIHPEVVVMAHEVST